MNNENIQLPDLQEYLVNAVRSAIDKVIQEKKDTLRSIGSFEAPQDEFLTQKEACKFLSIHESTIIRWRKDKKIPFHRLGRSILYSKNELIVAARLGFDQK